MTSKLLAFALGTALAFTPVAAMAEPLVLGWEDLLPGGGDIAKPVFLPEHDEGGLSLRLNEGDVPVNEELDGKEIRITGYLTPVSFTPGSRASRVSGFLLAPFTGVCVHVPPPPANQLILGNFAEGIPLSTRLSLDPVIIVGTISAKKATVDVTTAGYTVEVTSMDFLNDDRSRNTNRFTWGAN
jgi:hypothetical protein